MTETLPEKDPKPRRRRTRMAKVSLWSFGILLVMALSVAFVVFQSLGRTIAAPDWLRDRIEARVDELVPGVDVSMGEITFLVERDFSPRVSIDNVQLREAGTGRGLLALTRADAQLSRAAAFRGQVVAKEVSAAGLFLALRRSADGAFDLQLGDGLGASAPDLATLLRQIDEASENPQLSKLALLDLQAVTLEYQDAMSGRSWLIDGGRIQGTRGDETISVRADFALLSGGADVTSVEITASSPIGAPDVQLGMTLEDMPAADIAAQSAALSWLGALRAPVSGALRTGFDAEGNLLPLNATLQIGTGVLQPTDATRPIPFEAARTYFTFNAADQRFDFSEIFVASDWVSASGTGAATLTTDATDVIDGLTVQLQLAGVSANPMGIYDAPRDLEEASLDMAITLDPFELRIGQIALVSDATTVLAEGRARADKEGWRVSAKAQSPAAKRDDILRFWPEAAVPGTRKWINENVRGGTFRDLQFVVTADPGQPKPQFYLGAEIDGGVVRFLKEWPELTDIDGRLTLQGKELHIVADRGKVTPAQGGTITADGTAFSITNLGEKPANAVVDLKTNSTVTAVLALIDSNPLQVMTKAGRPVDLADGRAELEGRLSFPLKPKLTNEEMAYQVGGILRDVRSEKIVAGRTIAAPDLRVDVTKEKVRIAGVGRFDGVPFEGVWQLPLTGPRAERVSIVEADVELSERTLDSFNVALPPGTLSGAGQARLTVDLPPGQTPIFSLRSDLAGVGLRIDPLGWAMSRGTRGQFALSGALSQPVRIDRVSLEGPGLSGSGRIRLAANGRLQALEVDRLRVGNWLDAPVTLAGSPLAINVTGGTVDLRTAPFGTSGGGSGGGGAAGPLTLALDRLRVTDTLSLTNFRGRFASASPLSGDFTGRINGGAPIEGSAKAKRKGTAFTIRSEDAGDALRDAGIFKTLNDGALTLRLDPTGKPGTFDGELQIRQPRLRNAPAIAELLNAVSIVGLLTQLNGEGIYFDDVEAWFRMTPSTVTVTRSSAVGPAMGISLDGFYDIRNQRMDMQGVVSPLYAINILGRAIARKGEGLIGMTFAMKGPAQSPDVTVNPLSALTPGAFRDIFRRPPPTVSE